VIEWPLSLLFPLVTAAGADTLARLEMEARFARQELEAAQSGSFYIVVNEVENKVLLKIRGIELRAFTLQSLELGEPVFGEPRQTAWADAVCDFEKPTVERRQMKPGIDSVLEKLETTVEESTPPAFSLSCPATAEAYFVPDDRRGLRAWLSDRFAVGRAAQIPIRLRIRMAADDYRDLYRTIPDRGKLLFRVSDATPG